MAGEIDAHIGARLRRRRWLLGLTQTKLGDRVGIKFQQIQKYETGQNRVSASRLWELARALEAPVSYFYDGLGQLRGGLNLATLDGEPAGETAADSLCERETIDLVRAYARIPEPTRRRLFDLVRSMGEADAQAASQTMDREDAALRREAG